MAGSSRSFTAYELCLALGCSLHSTSRRRLPAWTSHTKLVSMQSLGRLHRACSSVYPETMQRMERGKSRSDLDADLHGDLQA